MKRQAPKKITKAKIKGTDAYLQMKYAGSVLDVWLIPIDDGEFHCFDLDDLLPLMLQRGLVPPRPPGVNGEFTLGDGKTSASLGLLWLTFYRTTRFDETPRWKCPDVDGYFDLKDHVRSECNLVNGKVYITTHFLKDDMLYIAFLTDEAADALQPQRDELNKASQEIMTSQPGYPAS